MILYEPLLLRPIPLKDFKRHAVCKHLLNVQTQAVSKAFPLRDREAMRAIRYVERGEMGTPHPAPDVATFPSRGRLSR